MYQALYRKWRPRVFSDVIGQDAITRTLRNQVAEGRTSHAYLFTGTRGTGKTTCAKILARAVNCENPQDGDPCCVCKSCIGLESGNYLDVLELDAASNNGVDQVRALRDEAIYAPANVRTRVYIIDEVHMLSTAAFNALLKILEEPPGHLIFILATTELHKVPATILSRCQRYSFKRIQPKDIQSRLLYIAGQEKIDLTPDGAELLSRLADGALRDGLSLLDQCAASGETINSDLILDTLGLAGRIRTAQLMEYISRREIKSALDLFGELYANGKDAGTILNELSVLIRDLLFWKIAPESGAALRTFDDAALKKLNPLVSESRLLYLSSGLQKAASDLYNSANRRLDAELCLLRLCDETLSGDLNALAARIDRLENALANHDFHQIPRPDFNQNFNQDFNPAIPANDSFNPGNPNPANFTVNPGGPPDNPEYDDMPPWDDADAPPPDDFMPPAPPDDNLMSPAPDMPPDAPSDNPGSRMTPETPSEPGNINNNKLNWPALAARCRNRLPVFMRTFLTNCVGVMESDRALTVYVPDGITLRQIDNDRVRTVLTEESGAARIQFREGDPPAASPEENLSQLLEFSKNYDNIIIKGQ